MPRLNVATASHPLWLTIIMVNNANSIESNMGFFSLHLRSKNTAFASTETVPRAVRQNKYKLMKTTVVYEIARGMTV